jgi:predicted transcriptional regulator
MARPVSRHPTELELEILKILWRESPVNVRHVQEALVGFRTLAYTSVMTIMGIMTRKGYLKRTKVGNGYQYRPRVTEEETLRNMVGDLVDRAFEGSAKSMVLNLIETRELDPAELAELRSLLSRKMKEAKS